MTRRPQVALVSVILLASISCLAAAPHNEDAPAEKAAEEKTPEPIQYGTGRKLCDLENTQIKESSGLACSRYNNDIFWTHNDSGDSPRVFAFNQKGENLATCTLAGAGARDWEDMCSFQSGRKSYLLLADVGDNACVRKECTIYVIPEPTVNPKKKDVAGTVKPVLTLHFRYEDGPHNCESVAVDAKASLIYLVSKENGNECKVYVLPLPKKAGREPYVAKAVATLKIPTTSAMDISPDGLRAIVLTYGDAYEYTRGPKEDWAAAFSREPRVIPMPRRRQGESICFGADGKTLYLTSERLPTPLLEVPVIEPEKADEKAPGEEEQKQTDRHKNN